MKVQRLPFRMSAFEGRSSSGVVSPSGTTVTGAFAGAASRVESRKSSDKPTLMFAILGEQFTFKNPRTEALVEAFSCSVSGSLLLQGRLYVGESCLCFYSNIFARETKIMIE